MSLFAVKNMEGEDIQQFSRNYINNNNLQSILSNIAEVKINAKKNSYIFPLWILGSFGAICLSIWYYLKKMLNYYGCNSYILISRRSEIEYKDYLSSKSKKEFYSISFIILKCCAKLTSKSCKALQSRGLEIAWLQYPENIEVSFATFLRHIYAKISHR